MSQIQHPLLLDESVYADMAQYSYNPAQWMSIPQVRTEATNMRRSSKKLDELCRKGVLMVGDILTMKKDDKNGVSIAFSATIDALDSYSVPMMRNVGQQAGEDIWRCLGPNKFDAVMVRAHPSLRISTRRTWDTIQVTRNDQDLGTMYMLRQCYQLWEDEMEKWGRNGGV